MFKIRCTTCVFTVCCTPYNISWYRSTELKLLRHMFNILCGYNCSIFYHSYTYYTQHSSSRWFFGPFLDHTVQRIRPQFTLSISFEPSPGYTFSTSSFTPFSHLNLGRPSGRFSPVLTSLHGPFPSTFLSMFPTRKSPLVLYQIYLNL